MGIHAVARKREEPGQAWQSSGAADLSALARRALASDQRVIGLMPVPAGGICSPVASDLAEALATLTPGNIAVIDAVGDSLDRAAYDAADPRVVARWLAPRIALVGAARRPAAGESAAMLGALVRYARARASATVIDLAGLEERGELSGAFSSCDGVVLVAPAGLVRDRELRAAAALVGEPLLLGVLLSVQ